MCHIVEYSSLRFAPDQIDEKLNALIIDTPPTETQPKTVRKTNIDYFDDNPNFKEFRVHRMFDFINPSTLTYDEWLAVGMALKNIGMNCSDWEQGVALMTVSKTASVNINGIALTAKATTLGRFIT